MSLPSKYPIYKFYDVSSLKKFKQLPKQGVISSEGAKLYASIPNGITVHPYTDDMLLPLLLTSHHDGLPLKCLASAFNYDLKVHPDATIFVTADARLADFANRFFGEDSIELI